MLIFVQFNNYFVDEDYISCRNLCFGFFTITGVSLTLAGAVLIPTSDDKISNPNYSESQKDDFRWNFFILFSDWILKFKSLIIISNTLFAVNYE